MNRPSFLKGALLGFCISIVAALLFSLLCLFVSSDTVIRCLIAVAGLFYVVQLIRLSGVRVGAVTTVTAWSLGSGLLLWFVPSLVYYLAAHIVCISLIRSLYFYTSLVSCFIDLFLSLVSLGASIWAAQHTGSVFLSFWCFFLVQSLWSAIPIDMKDRRHSPTPTDDKFQEAHRVAEAALGKLLSI